MQATAAITLSPSLVDERIIYEAIFRHVSHLSQLDWGSSDSIVAAQIAVELFPQLGYPIPHWVTELSQHKG
jgi:hypothetical protein